MLPEHKLVRYREDVFLQLFKTVPASQSFFKVSQTRMQFITGRILEMAIELFDRPMHAVSMISGVGLKHVGMNIPGEMFPPFVEALVQEMAPLAGDIELAAESFSWSMQVISQIMTHVNREGSTAVMKAISADDVSALKHAVAATPRGQRIQSILSIHAATESISPLYWSLDTGHLHCARFIIEDLLTIRADKDVYYYGCGALFERHRDVISKLCSTVADLLWPLLNGLVWRSRVVKGGTRRANFFIKNLVQDLDGNFSPNMQVLVKHQNPQVMGHAALVQVVDLIWFRLAVFHFIFSRLFGIITLAVFAAGQALLPRRDDTETLELNIAIAICRALLYTVGLGQLICSHVRELCGDILGGRIHRLFGVWIPDYMLNMKSILSAILMATYFAMLSLEPIIWCAPGTLDGEGTLFTTLCPAASYWKSWYSLASGVGLLLQWTSIMDLAVLSMKSSALVLAGGRVLTEMGLFLLAVGFLVLAFATALNALDSSVSAPDGVVRWAALLLQLVLKTMPPSLLQSYELEALAHILLALFTSLVSVFLLNLLIAQLIAKYLQVFEDMQGEARLTRADTIVQTLQDISSRRWTKFLQKLEFDRPMEFNEGDVGLAGGIQVLEPATEHVVLVDSIVRFGGSSAPDTPWPEAAAAMREDRFQRLERLLQQATSRQRGGRRPTMTLMSKSMSRSTSRSSHFTAESPASGASPVARSPVRSPVDKTHSSSGSVAGSG